MRERTTWNRDEIKRVAAMPKQADPYLMNQDHVSQNPRADKYMNGTPSSWAEDVHSPNEWEKEYANGQTKRNEVGEPEFRPETFSHPEKTASNQLLIKKADLTVKIARLMMPKAAENLVEDQAVALMALPDSDLIETFQRLAQDEEQGQAQQEPPAQQQQQAGQQDQQQQQAGQQDQQQQAGMQQQALQQQCIQALQQGDMPAAMAAMQQMQQQGSQADFPGGEWGKNNPVASARPGVKTTMQPRKAQQDQQGQGQAQQEPPAQQQAAVAPPVAGQQDQQQQQAGMQQQALQQQIEALQQQIQQMQAQQQGQQGMPQGMQQEPVLAHEDALLDEMLAPGGGGADMGGLGEIELEPASMDVGEIEMGPQDDVLKTLFANQETQDAEQAQQIQQASGQQPPAQNFNTVIPSGPYAPHPVQASNVLRSPASRTVGTRPTVGVSRVGGASAPAVKTASGEVDKLSNLWSSAPDVREHFGIK